MKRALNILSYVLNVILIASVVFLLISRGDKSVESRIEPVNQINEIKSTILQTERNRLPLRVQENQHVFSIQIDSVVFTNNVEPYSGYLITQWDLEEKQDLNVHEWASNNYKDKYVRTTKQIYIEIRNARIDKKGIVSWDALWDKASLDLTFKEWASSL